MSDRAQRKHATRTQESLCARLVNSSVKIVRNTIVVGDATGVGRSISSVEAVRDTVVVDDAARVGRSIGVVGVVARS